MGSNGKLFTYPLFILLCSFLFVHSESLASSPVTKDKKVLVVMSYNKKNTSESRIREELDERLRGRQVHYFYLDSKQHLAQAPKKAAEAYKLYLQLQPDAVITVDDNSQALFVLPYLKDKVKTPIVFCGVNNSADQYGYPTAHITGVLEKKHYHESISFAQLIDPNIKKIGVIYRDTPSNHTNVSQIKKEEPEYPARIVSLVSVTNVDDTKEAVLRFNTEVDAILVLNLAGIRDQDRLLEGNEADQLVVKLATKPTIAAGKWEIESGILCGVIKSNKEQGSLAAEKLTQIWQGADIATLPVTQNRNGSRYLNIITLKELGLNLNPLAVLGTHIVTHKK